MLKERLSVLALFLVLLSCNPKPTEKMITINETTKVLIDSLLDKNDNGSEENLELGSLDNLDIINGFRKLKLSLRFDSIDFKNSEIDTMYFRKGIIVVRINDFEPFLFGTGDDIELTFLNSKLTKIEISNGRYNSGSVFEPFEYFQTKLEDLIRLFGEPTSIIQNKHDYNRIIENQKENTDELEWVSKRVRMKFIHEWTTIKMDGLFEIHYLHGENSKLIYSIKDSDLILNKYIKEVEDSLKSIESKKQEEELIKRF